MDILKEKINETFEVIITTDSFQFAHSSPSFEHTISCQYTSIQNVQPTHDIMIKELIKVNEA